MAKDTYLVIHVDGVLMFSESLPKLDNFKLKLMSKFKMRDLTLNSAGVTRFKFLGLTIIKSEDNLLINQKDLIQKVLNKFNMLTCKPSSIPVQPNLNISLFRDKCKIEGGC